MRCSRFRIRAEQSQSDRCPCRRCAFSRRAAISCLTIGVQSTTRLQARFKKYRRFTGHRCALNTEEAIEIAKKKEPALNRRITGRETGKNRTGNRTNRAMNRTIAPASGGVHSLQRRNQGLRGDSADGFPPAFAGSTHPAPPENQNAPEAAGLRTRECHSALTAMRHSRQQCKRNSIYPRYSGVCVPRLCPP